MLKPMLKLLGFMPGEGKNKKPDPNARVIPITDVEDEDIPRYPPFAKGLPATDKHKVLATQGELIERIRGALGFSQAEFNKLLLPVLERYASFVHLLPASEAHHHRGAGGLFRHGLEAAFAAAQASEGVMFATDGTPKERRDNEPRWRLASVIAALLHDVGKPLSDMSITNKEGTQTWNPYSDFLLDWLQKNKIERYFLRWRDNRHKRHEKFSLLAMDRIIPEKTRDFIAQPGPQIMESLLEAVSGTSINNPVTKLMMFADKESVARDLKRSRLNVDEFAYGVPVERYVFDAIRRLVSSGRWKVNEKGAKVWYFEEGAFITWRNIDELYQQIGKDNIPGIPRDPDTLADILIERGHAIENKVTEGGQEATYRYWQVTPDELGIPILMLRFESHELVFTSEPPPFAKGTIGNPQQQENTGQTNSQAVPAQAAADESGAEDATDGTQQQAQPDQTDASNMQQIQQQAAQALGQVGSFDFVAGFGATEQSTQQDTETAGAVQDDTSASNVTPEQSDQPPTVEQSSSQTNNGSAEQSQPRSETSTPMPVKATGFRGMFVVEGAPPASPVQSGESRASAPKGSKNTKPKVAPAPAQPVQTSADAPVQQQAEQPPQAQERPAVQKPAPAKPAVPAQPEQTPAASGNDAPPLAGKRDRRTGLGAIMSANSSAGMSMAEARGLKFEAPEAASDAAGANAGTSGALMTNRLGRKKLGAAPATQNTTPARNPDAKPTKANGAKDKGHDSPAPEAAQPAKAGTKKADSELSLATGFMPHPEPDESGASVADVYEFSKTLSDVQLVEMLKKMMIEGRGRWLVGPVIETDGVYATSRNALQKIAAEQPEQSITKLSNLIRGIPQFKMHSKQIFFDPNVQRGTK